MGKLNASCRLELEEGSVTQHRNQKGEGEKAGNTGCPHSLPAKIPPVAVTATRTEGRHPS